MSSAGSAEGHVNGSESLDLRIIALFVIMAVSFIGVALPAFMSRFFSSRSDPTDQISYLHIVKLLNALGCGCVIATALCHIAVEANEHLAETLGEYPAAFAIATGTIVVLYCIEKELAMAVERRVHASAAVSDKVNANGPDSSAKGAAEAGTTSVIVPSPSADDAANSVTDTPSETEDEKLERLRMALVTHILEMGVAIHSILIGVALGLLTDISEVRPLFVALVFHQFCEGTAIGAAVLESRLNGVHTALMWAMFVLTTPIGVAIGIGVERSQGSDDSETSVRAQGILEAIALGILLYMGLVDMMPGLFNLRGCGGHGANPSTHKHAYMPFWYRLLVYFHLALGAGAMILIAKWA